MMCCVWSFLWFVFEWIIRTAIKPFKNSLVPTPYAHGHIRQQLNASPPVAVPRRPSPRAGAPRRPRRRLGGPREIHTPIAHVTSAASAGRETSRLNTDRISMTQLTHKYTSDSPHSQEM